MSVTERRIVLANSPVVGPLALTPLADALRSTGVDAEVAPAPFDLDEFVEVIASVAAEFGPDVVLAGFSAAGPRLFAVADVVVPRGLIFLDARLPADGVAPADEPAFAALLDSLPVDGAGMLPPWPTWWPPEAIAAICPDAAQRAAFVADCPPVPRSMYDRPIPAPPFAGACGFVSFGDAYADQVEIAEQHGWPVAAIDGGHLAPMVAPNEVASAIVDIAERMGVW